MIRIKEKKTTMHGITLPAIVLRNKFDTKYGEIAENGELKMWFNYQAFTEEAFTKEGLRAPQITLDGIKQGTLITIDITIDIQCTNFLDVIKYLNKLFVNYLIETLNITEQDIEIL